MKLEFWVTICLGHGDSGDVTVEVDVSDEEYELLKQCGRENEEIEYFDGLEDLYERVVEEVKEESKSCEPDSCEDIDYDDADYTVAVPQAVFEEMVKEYGANVVPIRYGVTFGKGDSSDWIDYEVELTDEEITAYCAALMKKIPLDSVVELEDALQRAYVEIEEMEIQNGIDMEDEYVLECQGLAPMDENELNELVADRDPHALAFFGLEDADDENLDEWDAYDLEEVPTIAEFQEDFEPYSPYDAGWTLHVEFVDPNE